MNRRNLLCLSSLTVFVAILLGATMSASASDFRIGFFEGGEYPAHAAFRNAYRDQLRAVAPADVNIVFVPDAFKSAGWDRDSSRMMASDLANNPDLDLVVAIGPWTVEDLLAAGFTRPILAVLRYDPISEQLLTERGRPLADNLTVRVRPRKLETDLGYLSSLLPVKRLGVLSFPSDDTTGAFRNRLEAAGRQFGFEIVAAEGYDRKGTFAFFNAYRALEKPVDAVYLPPLAGFNPDKLKQFYSMLARDGLAAVSAEGPYQVGRGALAATSYESALEQGTYQAWKTVRIIGGAVPAGLPVVYEDQYGLTVNGVVARQLGLNLASGYRPDLDIIEAPPGDDVERLNVVDAVAFARAQNPGLEAVRTRFLAAEQAVASARASYYPQLNLYGEAERVDRNEQNNHSRYDRSRYRAGVRVDQNLFALDVIRDAQVAAGQRQLAAQAAEQAGLDLELAVTAAFLDLYAADQQRLVEIDHVRKTAAALRLARLKLDIKEGKAADVWRLEQEWLAAQVDRRLAEAEVAIARAMLNSLMGRPADYPFVQDWGHFSDGQFFAEQAWLQRVATGPGGKTALVSRASAESTTNPELRQHDLQIDLARSELKRTNADFLPTVGFYATLEVAHELADREGWQEENPTWSLGARIDFPLFRGGARFRDRTRHQFGILQEQSLRDDVALKLEAEMAATLEEILSRSESFPPAARAAELAQQYYADVYNRFASNHADLTALVEALENDRTTSETAVQLQISYFRAVAAFNRLRGVSAADSNQSSGEAFVSWLSQSVP